MFQAKKIIGQLLITVSVLALSAGSAFATVGGPTYISQIAYKASDDLVYYLESDMGGKGCPSIIHSINLAKIKDIEMRTCDEVFRQFFKDYNEENQQKYMQFISDTYKSLSYLGSASLKKNNIDVQVEFLSEHVDEELDDYVLWSDFRATITQDHKEVAKLDFRGCAKDQPHIFEGYRVPNTDAMAILISNKGDCFEGGYVRESLSIVRGIKYYDANIVRSIKEESATEPNTGNMVVYAALKDVVNNNVNNTPAATPAPQKNPATETIIMAAIFIVGTTLGYILGRRSPRSPNPPIPSNL